MFTYSPLPARALAPAALAAGAKIFAGRAPGTLGVAVPGYPIVSIATDDPLDFRRFRTSNKTISRPIWLVLVREAMRRREAVDFHPKKTRSAE